MLHVIDGGLQANLSLPFSTSLSLANMQVSHPEEVG